LRLAERQVLVLQRAQALRQVLQQVLAWQQQQGLAWQQQQGLRVLA
jgi:hypothetical protein